MKKIRRNLQTIVAATTLTAIIIVLVGCTRSGTPPQPASTTPTSNGRVTELPMTDELGVTVTSTTIISRVDEEDNYILLKSEGMDTELLSIEGSGRIEFIHFGGGNIIEYKVGAIPQEEVKQLLNFLDSKGFFKMHELYTGKTELQGPVSDLRTTSIMVATQDKTHMVAVTSNAENPPVEFSQIINELKKVLPSLIEQPSGIYIKAQQMDPKDVNVLRLNEVGINEFTEEQLALIPPLQEAIFEPGRLVYINEDYTESILQYEIKTGFFQDHFYLKYDGQHYDVSVLEKTT